MNLLIITQKVDKNDPVLGFFYGWLLYFSKKATNVFVIANEVGEYDLPENIKVLSLGKEKNKSRLERYWEASKLIFEYSRKSDGIFIHMCPEYAIFAWLFSMNKKILMWYVHKSENWKLWLAEKMVDKIFTVSEKSCNVDSKKIEIVGHGTDDHLFRRQNEKKEEDFKLLSVGRISSIKDYKTLLQALCYLINKKEFRNIKLNIVGDVYLGEDKKYKEEIFKFVKEKKLEDYVDFVGSKTRYEMPNIYNSHDLLINQCPTGGMDKVVLEAGACELPVLVANESFLKFIEGYDLIFQHKNPKDLAEKILRIKKMDEDKRREIGRVLRSRVEKEHNLSNLVDKIIKEFE